LPVPFLASFDYQFVVLYIFFIQSLLKRYIIYIYICKYMYIYIWVFFLAMAYILLSSIVFCWGEILISILTLLCLFLLICYSINISYSNFMRIFCGIFFFLGSYCWSLNSGPCSYWAGTILFELHLLNLLAFLFLGTVSHFCSVWPQSTVLLLLPSR
jgi:hypothetical protein